VCFSVGQVVKNLLHALNVFPESDPAFIGEAEHGAGLFVHKFFLDINVTCRFQLAHVRGQIAPRQPGLAHQEGKIPAFDHVEEGPGS
jgi:hypothetical protein